MLRIHCNRFGWPRRLALGAALCVVASGCSRSTSSPDGDVSALTSPDESADHGGGALPGPPQPVIRNAGSDERLATRFEVGSADEPVYIDLDPTTQQYSLDPEGFLLPRNLYADPGTRVALSIVFNEPIDPSSENLSHLGWEYESVGAGWIAQESSAGLLESHVDATIARVAPVGPLPSGRRVRVVIQPGFRDASGEATLVAIDDFAVANTEETSFASLSPGEALADELREDFDFGGAHTLEDEHASLPVPAALWGDGVLRSSAGAGCTGGPFDDFDWVIKSGQTLVFDTTATAIIGGPGGLPTVVQNAVGGIVELDDFTVELGGTLRVQGPNPMRICATGEVTIRGLIDISGFDAKDVATLNTGHIPEQGGAGGPGGGRGGNSSTVTNGSTPRGSTGLAPSGDALGGQGGESAFAPAALGKDARRPGGGGGGRFAADVELGAVGLFAEDGFPGHPDGKGAESGLSPAQGGSVNAGAFSDADPSNDFYGVKALKGPNGEFAGTLLGELAELQGGYGGGGGGDAIPSASFPNVPWNPASDEKGGPGAGAGGALHVRALGPIVFGNNGRIKSRGGEGGTGENTLFLDHIGGSGGSASGGMVVLESATRVDFTGGDPDSAPVREYVTTRGGKRAVGPVSSGGGTNPQGISHGGTGGPGLVQVHVPFAVQNATNDPSAGIVLPTAALSEPDPLAAVATPAFQILLPDVDSRSMARSRWIATGGAGVRADGSRRALSFLFEGIEARGPDAGRVITGPAGRVMEPAPVLGPLAVGAGGSHGSSSSRALEGGAVIARDGVTLRLGAGALAAWHRDSMNDLYLRTPELLEGFVLRLQGGAHEARDFEVAAASYDDDAMVLSLTVAEARETLADYAASAGGSVSALLVPRFFRVASNGALDRVPENGAVRILVQATSSDANGRPDEERVLVDWTGDVSALNALPPGELGWFRFQVEFDTDVEGRGAHHASAPISLDFLRLPFRF